ncbi:MAG: hypothetical protein A3J62_03935 [Candidatus Buchananbacteria bacterium RIFCSPHIGHO2_02_FULL_38_8]|uniref:DUF2933 domain-containing protein n=1 Tax=Candidatus Buchananbacteria bacterium RIFCSPHIGHO2_02_FULL_38_8 TaxID=1797538 RepID=A0A1G1Y5U1_9BACT|nr:MAG: hypothetical protein A3J62_03935 [Candidatus Buchananbacteria bacterium RIFCSPHIGHO2_02_FULL_38_8]
MFKNFWLKLKHHHLWLMLFGCLLIFGILGIGLKFFPQLSDNWFWLIILLCPLAHLLMMGGHKHQESFDNKKEENLKIYRCSECGLLYRQKEWAEKCQSWCLKYKSCNLEITKHAIK